MRIGIPNGLLLVKYRHFAENFFGGLGLQTLVSPGTNKSIMDMGIKYSVDDACLPIKIFHGHVLWLMDKCDYIFVPRVRYIEQKKYICPLFCGIPEMIKNSIPGKYRLLSETIYSADEKTLSMWSMKMAKMLNIKKDKAIDAYNTALNIQNAVSSGYNDEDYKYRVALIGHIYNLYDSFVNMNLINKLHRLGISIVTSDFADKNEVDKEISMLSKTPFWYFAAQYYGAALNLYKSGAVQGIVYVSAFSCGVDSVVIELIRNSVRDFPFMVLKIDEHTGEAGFDTRIEAFADMLKRRASVGNNVSENGEYMHCNEIVV